ncbi:DNA polymerase III subunit gamma/tau [Candidatus Sumerlaeota bacterium]|nr:DNA polymerase III subunit gamma/tau [Candidatus Sumerlaeota bacterium]
MKKKSENYIVFARKWRPQTFEEVVGQTTVKRQLQNALSEKRIANAYLFAGPRGVGKTSVARILAKALNCEKGVTATPCNKCDQCVSITHGNSMDVIEIDGASYTGIDSIRDLQEGINRTPFAARKKVYIIDEVHMLSGSAFNALLKTLEEPPSFVVFIFATTQIEKIPETIKSRCQIFPFERISNKDIIDRLDLILSQEKGIKMNPEEKLPILEAIASSSEGGMRDAEVALDQLISLSAGKLKFEHVSQLLGLVELDLLIGALQDIVRKDVKALLERVAKLVEKGRDLERFVKTFQAFLRDLLILKAGGGATIADYSRERLEDIRNILQNVSLAFLLNVMNNFFSLEERMKSSAHIRFLLEFVFIKLCVIQDNVDIDSIMDKLEQMQKNLPAAPARSASYSPPPLPGIPDTPDIFNNKAKNRNSAQEIKLDPLDEKTLLDTTQLWEKFKTHVAERKHVLDDVLNRCSIISFRNNALVIQSSPGYDEKFLTTPDSLNIMEAILNGLVGSTCKIRIQSASPSPQPALNPLSELPCALSSPPINGEEGDSESQDEVISLEQDDIEQDPVTERKKTETTDDLNLEKYRHLFQETSVPRKIALDILKKNPDIQKAVELIKKTFNAQMESFDGKKIS